MSAHPHPKNEPGPFYVQDRHCIECRVPHYEAPDLIAHDEESDYQHCYFKKQPETPDEVERAISACCVACVGAVRYAGNDPTILARFREQLAESGCDAIVGPLPTPDPAPPFPVNLPEGPPYPRPDRSHPLWDHDLDG